MGKHILVAGVGLGLACEAWTFVMGFTGWYKDPAFMNLFFLVILIEIGWLVWALGKPAEEGLAYRARVGTGVAISFIAALVIAVGSILFTTVVFPEYFDEINAAYRTMMAAKGMSEEQIAETLEGMAAVQSPLMQAVQGVIGTVLTGLIASMIIAAVRKPKAS